MIDIDAQTIKRQQKEKQQWIGCDPVTLVAAARQELYERHQDPSSAATGPIEEALSRLDQQSRATLGSFVPFGSGTGQQN